MSVCTFIFFCLSNETPVLEAYLEPSTGPAVFVKFVQIIPVVNHFY